MKINELYVEPSKENDSIFVSVVFTTDKKPYGYLAKYVKALVVSDVSGYEKSLKKTQREIEHLTKSWSKVAKAYNETSDRYISYGHIRGADKIIKLSENKYKYAEYVSDCLITRACIVQIANMAIEIDNGICSFGDCPELAGCFRSGDVVSDFYGILETLDRFWD